MNLSLPWLARGEVGAKTFRDADRLVEFARGAVNYGPDEWRKLFAANSGGDDVRQTLIAAFGAASEYLTIQLAAVEKARALMQDAGPEMYLDPDRASVIWQAARRVDDDLRDQFLKHVQDLLRPRVHRGLQDSDVVSAINDALRLLGHVPWRDRANLTSL